MRRLLVDALDHPLGELLARRGADRGFRVEGPAPWRVDEGSEVTVVIWGTGSELDLDGSGRPVVDPASVEAWCASLDGSVVEHVTLVSSAAVFGPAADHPVPLTEAAPRPSWPPGHPARRWADVEDVVVTHAAAAGWPLAVLRPAVVVVGAVASRHPLGEASPWNPRVVDVDERDPYRQFLHVDDLLDAMAFVAEHRLVGTFHVAPDGWIRAGRQRELSGRFLPRDPVSAGDDVEACRHDPVFSAYLANSVVVSSEALAAAGWRARRTNDEAVIESAAEGWWSSLTARRRQEVSLGALVGLAAAAVGIGVGVARRWGGRGSR